MHEAVNTIRWVNQFASHGPSTGPLLISATLAGLKRSLAKPKVKKGLSKLRCDWP